MIPKTPSLMVNALAISEGGSKYMIRNSGGTTRGNNTAEFPPVTITGYHARPGWDPVTGWGSPDAQVLVPLLARYGA